MTLLFLIACGDAPPTDSDADAPVEEIAPVGEMILELNPTSLEFGAVGVGVGNAQVVSLYNAGSSDLMITDLTVSDDDTLTAELSGEFVLAPGAYNSVTVTWTPDAVGEMTGSASLLVGPSLSDQAEIQIPVSGDGDGAELFISLTEHDFGTVDVGCESSVEVTVANVGTQTLNIEEVGLSYDSEFSLADLRGDPLPELPWELGVGKSQDMVLYYTPNQEAAVNTILEVVSDDPASPSASLAASGDGSIDSFHTETFDVTGYENVTVIVMVNAVVNSGTYGAPFHDALPVFFDTLRDAGPDFRVAFVHQTSGVVDSATPYIDQDDSTEDAVAKALDMIQNASGDNDYMLTTWNGAIAQNTEWLIDGGPEWADSKLSLIGINNDLEQSGGSYKSFLKNYQSYKEDPNDIVAHAISGECPTGCNTGSSYAEGAGTTLCEIVEVTGGAFLSFCEEDWTSHMETLALGTLGDNQTAFYLTREASNTSVAVAIDGITQDSGWSYNADLNAIVFEEGYYPQTGSQVSVSYVVSGACDE